VMKDYQLSEVIPLGARATFTAPTDGDLYLRCQEDLHRLADNDGKLTVHFRRSAQEFGDVRNCTSAGAW
jgi:hypothetical protein